MATPENQDAECAKAINSDLEMTSDSANELLLPKKKSKWESEDSDSEGTKQQRKKRKRDKRVLKVADLQPSTRTASPSPCSEDIISTSPSTPPPIRLVVRPPPLKAPTLSGCRRVDNYEKLNRIEEGAYGVVFRAKDRTTGDIVALKKLKLDKEKNGFPITSLREIHTLMLCKHPNIVNVREIVVGDKQDQIFIVMDFVEHDLKSLMEDMHTPFLQSEVKTIMLQLLSAIALMHNNWMIHRDLKTSNLLLNNRGEIKVADFGLARKYGSPLGPMTGLVVTLWYRAPELLLGAKEYSTSVDMWSIGCIFGELVNKEPLFPGQTEIDQMNKIFKLLGVPNEKIWPGVSNLPNFRSISWADMPYNNLRSRFPYLTENGLNLLSRLLNYDPQKRITAEEALKHAYFFESPAPKDPFLFPTWPSKGSGEKKKQFVSPSAPQVAHAGQEMDDDDALLHGSIFDQHAAGEGTAGFRLKLM